MKNVKVGDPNTTGAKNVKAKTQKASEATKPRVTASSRTMKKANAKGLNLSETRSALHGAFMRAVNLPYKKGALEGLNRRGNAAFEANMANKKKGFAAASAQKKGKK